MLHSLAKKNLLLNSIFREWRVAMTTMESPQIQVTSYDDTSKKVPEQDDFDKELESFIETRKNEESKVRTAWELASTWQLQIPAISLKNKQLAMTDSFFYSLTVYSLRKSTKQSGFICLSVWKFESYLNRESLYFLIESVPVALDHLCKVYQLPSWLISW